LGDYRAEGPPLRISNPLEDEFAQEMAQSSNFDDSNLLEIGESRSRRLLELRLMQNYVNVTCTAFAACHLDSVLHAWSSKIPNLALQHDNLLYQVLAMSALHLLSSSPNDPELVLARQTYRSLALQEHRRAVSKLSIKSADAVCCAASLVYIDAFASIQARPIEPYLPPMEWLHLARGAGSLYHVGITALHEAKVYQATVIYALTAQPSYFDEPSALFKESNRQELLVLLTQDIPGEPWDQETQQAYEKTLSYIGWVQIAIKKGEHRLGVCRRMMSFPVLAPKKFIEFVGEMRPRALVILAYWFALGAQLTDLWWIGETIQREVQAIQRVVPLEWQLLMRDPLLRVGLTAI
jgi:hypothetical protein